MIILVLLLIGSLLQQGTPVAPRREGAITGQVLTASGAPIAGLRVAATESDIRNGDIALVSIAITDGAGRYRLENLPRGRYLVMAGAIDLPTYFAGVTAREKATSVMVDEGRVTEQIDFKGPFVSFDGRVAFDDGVAALSGSLPLKLTFDGAVDFSADLRPDGSFRLPYALPGVYRVSVGDIARVRETSVRIGDKDTSGFRLFLITGETETLLLQGAQPDDAQSGARSGTISGRLLRSDGTPAVNVRVLAVDTTATNPDFDSGSVSMAHTDKMGSYRLEGVPPGRYFIVAGPRYAETSYPGVSKAADLVTVADGKSIEGIDFKVDYVSVRGRVVLQGGGTPDVLPGVRLTPIGPGPRQLRADVAAGIYRVVNPDRDGTFEFNYVPPGTYRLGDWGATLSVVVTDKDVSDLQLVIAPNITGRIVVEGGRKAPEWITFQFRGDCVRPECFESMSSVVQTDGSFRTFTSHNAAINSIVGVGPDTYSIKAVSRGGVILDPRSFRGASREELLINLK